MNNFIQTAQADINLPEVQEAMRTLSKYGLGVNVPHMHDHVGQFETLENGTVSFEQSLNVSFVNDSSSLAKSGIAVAWRWDETAKSSVVTAMCRFGGSGCVSHD